MDLDEIDPLLLREKDRFKQRAIAATKKSQEIREAASKAKQDAIQHSPKPPKKKKKSALQRPKISRASHSPAKNLSHLSDNPRRLLKAIIDVMKERHSKQEYEPLSFEDMLFQISCTTSTEDTKQSLLYDLKNNPKINYDSTTDMFHFKPALGSNVRNRKQLLNCLMEHDQETKGGILVSEIKEAVCKPEKAIAKLDEAGQIYRITRQDKEEVVFYRNTGFELDPPLSEEFKARWHTVSVDGMTDDDIEKYLTNTGIGAMGGEGRKRKAPSETKKAKKKSRVTKILNVHLDDSVLKDYSADS